MSILGFWTKDDQERVDILERLQELEGIVSSLQEFVKKVNPDEGRPYVQIWRADKTLPLPERRTEDAAGFDICIADNIILLAHERRRVGTGLYIALPSGYECQLRPRSGLAAKHGMTILNSPATIDADYRGELQVLVYNTSFKPLRLKKGERIAQMVIARIYSPDFEEVDAAEALPATQRGSGGFGSTG